MDAATRLDWAPTWLQELKYCGICCCFSQVVSRKLDCKWRSEIQTATHVTCWHCSSSVITPIKPQWQNLMPFEMQLKDGEVKGGQNQKGEKLKACLVVLTKVSLISLKHTLLHVIPQTSPRLLPFPGIQTARIYLFPFPQRTSSLHNQFIHSSKSNVFQNIISHPSTLSTSTLNAFYPLPWFCIQGAILFLRHWITHSLTLSHVFKP